MTPRYRCPWCPQTFSMAPPFRRHITGRHGKAIMKDLRPFETFGTRKTPDPPRNARNPLPTLNPGVSGEGDS